MNNKVIYQTKKMVTGKKDRNSQVVIHQIKFYIMRNIKVSKI